MKAAREHKNTEINFTTNCVLFINAQVLLLIRNEEIHVVCVSEDHFYRKKNSKNRTNNDSKWF
jgi:hypothetical protein